MKPILTFNPQPTWNSPGDGSGGGGEPTVDAPDTPPAFDWGDIDDDVRAFIGDKTPEQVAKEARAHQQGATRRIEQLREELLKDDEFIKGISTDRGLVEAPKDDAEFIDFAKGRIGEDAKYDIPKLEGANPELLQGWQGAAREVGIAPGQLSAFMKAVHGDFTQKAAANAEAITEALKGEWGGDYDENMVQAQNALSMFDNDGADLMVTIANLPPNLQSGAIKSLAQLGALAKRAETNGDGVFNSGNPTALSFDEALALLKEKGSIDKMNDFERQQYEAAMNARMQEKKGA